MTPGVDGRVGTGSGRAVVVVLKHLNGLAHKQDLLSHSDGDVGRQHLRSQGELLKRRGQHVLLLDQPLLDSQELAAVTQTPRDLLDSRSHQVLQLSELFSAQASQSQVLLFLVLVGGAASRAGALLYEELLALVQQQPVQHPGGELLVHHAMTHSQNPAGRAETETTRGGFSM